MIVQERDDLPAHLQRRHIAVQVNPVQALHVQHHMTIEQIGYLRDTLSHSLQPRRT